VKPTEMLFLLLLFSLAFGLRVSHLPTCAQQNSNGTFDSCANRSDLQCTGGQMCMVVDCDGYFTIYYPTGYAPPVCPANSTHYAGYDLAANWIYSLGLPCSYHLFPQEHFSGGTNTLRSHQSPRPNSRITENLQPDRTARSGKRPGLSIPAGRCAYFLAGVASGSFFVNLIVIVFFSPEPSFA
jgi:hypothetical protein